MIDSVRFFGYYRWQKFFEKLDAACLVGMNIGRGGDIYTSGEMQVLKYIKGKSPSNLIIFDIGANIGDYSKIIRDYFNQKVDIYAFEPSQSAFQKLSKNLEKDTKTKLYNFGFSDVDGSVKLFNSTTGSGLGSIYNRRLEHFETKMEEKEQIKLKTLDDFCKENNISQIDFLKLDVEGHELKVLEGAHSILKSGAIKYIQFEFGGCDIDSRTFFQDFWYLLKDDFNFFRVVKNGLYPIKEYKETHERFINTNFFAERK